MASPDIAAVASAWMPLPHGLPPARARDLRAFADQMDEFAGDHLRCHGIDGLGDTNLLHHQAAGLRDRAAGLERGSVT